MTRQSRLLLALCLLSVHGCGSSGPELATVSGTIRLDGTPLAGAMVTFTPEQGRPSYGGTDDNGYYELAFNASKMGALPGNHTVKISTHRRGDSESGTKAEKERIPTKFNSKSELKKKVEPGSNTIDIEISSKDGKVVQPSER